MVRVTNSFGVSLFYAGVSNRAEAFLMAARHGYEADEVGVQEVPNKFGIQPGEWRQAAP